MKLLLISKSDTLKDEIGYHFSPLGFRVEAYDDPLQVINQLDQLFFDVIVFDAKDFPRHWKPLIKLIRDYKSKEKAVVILTNKNGFPFEEASKAAYLEINALIYDNLSSRQLIYRLEEILRRYKALPDNRKFARLLINEKDRVSFLFTHPVRMVLVFGEVLDISIQGMNFMPLDPDLTKDILPGHTIENGSLRIGDEIININYTVTRNRGSMGIMFESFSSDGHNRLFHYLMNRPERELNSRIRQDIPEHP